MMREAVEAYKVRVQLGEWKEEAFEAQMRVVSIARHPVFHCLEIFPPGAIRMGSCKVDLLAFRPSPARRSYKSVP